MTFKNKLIALLVVSAVLMFGFGICIELGGFGFLQTLTAACLASFFVAWAAFISLMLEINQDYSYDRDGVPRRRRREEARKAREAKKAKSSK